MVGGAIRRGVEAPGHVVAAAADRRGAGRGDGEMTLLGALRRLRLAPSGLGLRDAALDGDVETGLAGGANHEGRVGRHRDRSAAARLHLLAGAQARQDQRRPAGVGRRRHPGVDPVIGRRHHAMPVERGSDAPGAVAAGGKERRNHQDQHQRAQRIRVARGDMRDGWPAFSDGAARKRALQMRAPQRDARTDRRPPAPCGRRSRWPADAAAGCCGRAGAGLRSRRPAKLGAAARSPPPRARRKRTRRWRGRAAAAIPKGRARTARGTGRPRSQATPAPATAAPTASEAGRARAPRQHGCRGVERRAGRAGCRRSASLKAAPERRICPFQAP